MLGNIIAVIIIVAAVGSASYYIYKEKKKGAHCIGCPMAGSCPRKNLGTHIGDGSLCGLNEKCDRGSGDGKNG